MNNRKGPKQNAKDKPFITSEGRVTPYILKQAFTPPSVVMTKYEMPKYYNISKAYRSGSGRTLLYAATQHTAPQHQSDAPSFKRRRL